MLTGLRKTQRNPWPPCGNTEYYDICRPLVDQTQRSPMRKTRRRWWHQHSSTYYCLQLKAKHKAMKCKSVKCFSMKHCRQTAFFIIIFFFIELFCVTQYTDVGVTEQWLDAIYLFIYLFNSAYRNHCLPKLNCSDAQRDQSILIQHYNWELSKINTGNWLLTNL